MNNNIDLDVNGYELDEIISILKLTPQYLTKQKILTKIDQLRQKYENNDVFFNFFDNMRVRVLNELNHYQENDFIDLNEDGGEEDSEEEEEDIYKEQRKMIITQKEQEELSNLRNKISQSRDYKFKKVYGETLNIDSRFRPIINFIDVCDPNSNINKIKRLGDHTNFTLTLSKPLKNVVELKIKTIEIPYSWYTFSHDYGTDHFFYKFDDVDNYKKVTINSGNYSTNQLIVELNEKVKLLNLEIKYSENTKKISIKNNNSKNITIKWYTKQLTHDKCYGTTEGQKLNYNLGWLLGFREIETKINGTKTETTDGLLDVYGPKYLLLVMEDYINNKPNSDMISEGGNFGDVYKIPSYWNKYTMEKGCQQDIVVKNNCGIQPLNVDLSSNLTLKQKYTVEQIKTRLSNEKLNIYQNPIIKEVLAKLPINRDSLTNFGEQLKFRVNVNKFTRNYFGPVNLKKLNIKLLDEYGNAINLNNMDWSFTLEVIKERTT